MLLTAASPLVLPTSVIQLGWRKDSIQCTTLLKDLASQGITCTTTLTHGLHEVWSLTVGLFLPW